MMEITKDEAMLIMIYSPGYRKGLISELEQMKSKLQSDETQLKSLTDEVIKKVHSMTDEEFKQLDLY